MNIKLDVPEKSFVWLQSFCKFAYIANSFDMLLFYHLMKHITISSHYTTKIKLKLKKEFFQEKGFVWISIKVECTKWWIRKCVCCLKDVLDSFYLSRLMQMSRFSGFLMMCSNKLT